jgi:hypothetical protein
MKKLLPITSVFVMVAFGNVFADTDVSYKPYNDPEWLNLLHYDGGVSLIDKDSDFFLSTTGYKNPEQEYKKTLDLLQDKSLVGDKSIQCAYPARTAFILKHEKIKLDRTKCPDYDTFNKSVPIDYIELGFAAENNKSPVSMMGHAFLVFYGETNNVPRRHIFAYSANITDVSITSLVVDGIFMGLNGAYVLKPYDTYSRFYLDHEQRSIWKFKLDLTPQQIANLKMHIWELKQHNIQYSLLFHNCNTATVGLLKVADTNLRPDDYGLFLTPVEYIQQISNAGHVIDITIDPTEQHGKIINKYGLNYILDANRPSKISLGYKHAKEFDGISVKFSPIYQDIHDVTDAYFDALESKMLDVQFDYLFGRGIVFNDITFLKLRSVTDTFLTHTPTKHVNFSLNNTPLNDSTKLYPVAEFGVGMGVHNDLFKFYVTPILGYQYRHKSIVYVMPEIGIISQIGNIGRIVLSYNPYINIIGDQNKYDCVTGHIGYKISKSFELYTSATYYYNFNHNYTIQVGIGKYF